MTGPLFVVVLQLLIAVASLIVEHGLLLHMWNFLGPGTEPVSPVLAGGFLLTATPGKPGRILLNQWELQGKNMQSSHKERRLSNWRNIK